MQSQGSHLIPAHSHTLPAAVHLLLLQVPMPIAAVPDLYYIFIAWFVYSCCIGQHYGQQL